MSWKKPEDNPGWHVDRQGNFHWGSAEQAAQHRAQEAGRKTLETRLREADGQPARQPRENGQERER